MVCNVPWNRLEALVRYTSLERVVVVVYKSCDDCYAPECYTEPIANSVPKSEENQNIEILTDYSFWEDIDESGIENILEV